MILKVLASVAIAAALGLAPAVVRAQVVALASSAAGSSLSIGA